jgi:hypothetical protein
MTRSHGYGLRLFGRGPLNTSLGSRQRRVGGNRLKWRTGKHPSVGTDGHARAVAAAFGGLEQGDPADRCLNSQMVTDEPYLVAGQGYRGPVPRA